FADRRIPDDADLVLLVLAEFYLLGLLDYLGAGILIGAFAGENLGADDRPFHPRRDTERGVAYVACLLAEDGAQELFLRRQLRFPLRGDLPDQDIARAHFRADPDNPRLVQVLEGLLAEVGDVGSDLFLPQLGVACHALELLDVDRGIPVVLDQLLGD